ncbi:MAG: DNA polymerase III subunit alpha [Candidatus Spechtbacterales bacterium]
MKNYKFTHLHVHSHYSLLDGLPKIGELLDHIKKMGMDSIAITDHGNLYGAIEFYQKAKKRDIKPIIGCEIYVTQDMRDKQPGASQNGNYDHLVVLAENNEGYRNLIKLVTKSNLEGFYYKPRVDKNLLREHANGLIALSGCLGGELSRALDGNDTEKAKSIALEYADIFGKNNYFIEIQQHLNTPEQNVATPKLAELAGNLKMPLVATQDSHYLKKEDAHAHDVLLAVQTGNTIDDENRLTMKHDDFSLLSGEEMAEKFKEWPDAIENTQKIAERCRVELTLGEFIFPNFALVKGKTADQMLDELTKEGAQERALDNNVEIEKRRQYELKIIKEKKYAPYFLVVADLLRFARESDIYSTVRGSAAGSLIAYLSGITNVNPMEYQLPFERFLNPFRPSAPDIDMDFADNRRQEVIEYAKNKYGADRVAQIITFGTMMARAAVRDVARALGKPYETGDKIAKLIPMGHQGFPMTIEKAKEIEQDLRILYEQDAEAREIMDIAEKLEGTVRHASVHAAGVVISPKPLTEYVPVQLDPKGADSLVTQYDMYTVGEDGVGLTKLDFLGIRNLAILENAVKLVYERHRQKIDIENIPFDDKKTFNMLSRGETEGLFQLNGSGMTQFLMDLKPTTVHDINAMVALYRPGPMKNIPEYIARKQGRSPIRYFHKKAEKFLDKSYGILVYQDDLLFTAMELAGYNWESVDKFRKAVGKKIPAEMAKQHKIFVKGCQDHSEMTERQAEEVWDLFEPFQGYGFNKAHAACYGRVAYQTAYMKANFPVDYMCAVLTAEAGDMEKMTAIMTETQHMGIKLLPPSVNESGHDFTVINNKIIRFGLAAIKNVGENVVNNIIEERTTNGRYASVENLMERMSHGELNKKSLESLIKAGALDDVGERNSMLANIEKLLQYSKQQRDNQNSGQSSLFGDAKEEIKISMATVETTSPIQKLDWEKELLGFYITGHPLNEYKQKLAKFIPINKIKADNMRNGKVGVIINSIKKITTRDGKPMAFMTVEDLSDKIEAIVFPDLFEKNKDMLEENRLVVIRGKLSMKDREPKLICEEITELS